jgi:tetratricopeptide (TPR) repeat protein
VTLARPELLERRPTWGAGKRNFTSLTLEPMPAPAMRQLLLGLVPGLPEAFVKVIVARADGIPLYAVETVRMLLAEGRLIEKDGAYQPVGALTDMAVPETLQALISARLDGLDPADRSLLQDAAVLGQSFTIAGLAAVSGEEAGSLEPRLRALVRRELLILEADPRSPERGQYAFIQALIRDVAYNTLARADRKSRHLAAARWFEALGEGELAGALAAQYLAAFRSAPAGAEADALANQARLALKGAADRASAMASYRQALGFLRQALETTADPAELAALRERAADAASSDADFDAANEYIEQAIAWYRSQGDRVAIARATTALAIGMNSTGKPLAAANVLEEAMAEAGDLEAEPDVVRLLTELSRAYAIVQDPRALATADRALAAAENLELGPSITEALVNRALALTNIGRLQEPIAILRGILPFAEAQGLADTQLRILNNLAATLGNEDLRATYDISGEALEVARRLGRRGWLGFLLQGRVGLAIWVGEWAEADRMLAEVDLTELAPSLVVSFTEDIALLHAYHGEFEQATQALAQVAPLRTQYDDPRVAGWGRLIDSHIHLLAGRLEEAYESGMAAAVIGLDASIYGAEHAARAAFWLGDAERARAALQAHLARPERGRLVAADRLFMSAGLRALDGDRRGALPDLRSALAVYRDLGIAVFLGLDLMSLAYLMEPGSAEARAAIDEAREIFTRLGAPPILERLDAMAAGPSGQAAPRPEERVKAARRA